MSYIIKSHVKNPSDYKIAVRWINRCGYKSIDEFIDLLKKEGWEGQRVTKVDGTIFTEPYLTHLDWRSKSLEKHPITEWESYPMEDLVMDDNYVDFVPNSPFIAKKGTIKLVDIKDYHSYGEILPIFYDIEITKLASYIGILIPGFEILQIDICEFPKFLKYISCCSNTKKIVFICYNDSYDASIIKMVIDKLKSNKGKPLSNYDYNNINHKYIEYSDRLQSIQKLSEKRNKNKSSFEKKRILKEELDYYYVTNKIPVTSLYNDLNNLVPEGDFYTFDMFNEMFSHAGSLKHHCLKAGIVWKNSLYSNNESEQREYNKEDLINTRKLFDLNNGIEYLQMLFEILKNSPLQNRKIRSLSTKLVVWARMEEIPFRNRIKPEFNDQVVINKFCEENYKKHNVIEHKGQLLYSKTNDVIMKCTEGGIHSECQPCYETNEDYNLYDIDFTSFYPHIMISDDCPIVTDDFKSFIRKAMEDRISKKKTGDALVATALKPVINSFYGCLNKHHKDLCRTVTAVGQSLVIELLRFVEEHSVRIIDVNTDGIIAKFNKNITPEFIISNIKTILPFYPIEVTKIEYILYKCIGCYLLKTVDGKYKSKGSWIYSTKYQKMNDDDNVSYNIVNIEKILIEWIENKRIISPEVIKLITIKDKYRHYSLQNIIDKQLDNSSILEGSSPCSKNRGFKFLNEDELSKWIICSKLMNCNVKETVFV